MVKRMVVMLAVTALLVAALGFVKFKQIQTAIGQAAAFQPPPEAVTTIVAAEQQWPQTLSAIGTIAAVQGVTVSADLPGTVERIGFDSGRAVARGRGAGAARHAPGTGAARRGRIAARAGTPQLTSACRACSTSTSCLAPSSTARQPTTARATRTSARSGRRSTARRFVRRSPVSWESDRSISASTSRPGQRSSRCSRSIRSTSTSACRSRQWPTFVRGAACA